MRDFMVVCGVSLLCNLGILAMNLKLYTEIQKLRVLRREE